MLLIKNPISAWRDKANTGHAPTQFVLGKAYFYGDGVEPSLQKACYWIRHAAQRGWMDAQYFLGRMFEQGEVAAFLMFSTSNAELAEIYNLEQAISWYRKAAEQGSAPALYALSSLYAQGKGVVQDRVQSLKYLYQAAQAGHSTAQIYLKKLHLWLTEPSWYNELAEFKCLVDLSVIEQANIGMFLAQGQNVQPVYEDAVRFLQQGVIIKWPAVQNELARLYQHGLGTAQDLSQALSLFTKAAAQDYAPAQLNLGFMFLQGQGVPQSYERAVLCFKRAAKLDFAPAQYELAELYIQGRGVPQDLKSAWQLLHQAAKHKCGLALLKLGKLYQQAAKAKTAENHPSANSDPVLLQLVAADLAAEVSFAGKPQYHKAKHGKPWGSGKGRSYHKHNSKPSSAHAETETDLAPAALAPLAPPELSLAVGCWQIAAATGLAEAQFLLGQAFLHGQGIAQDLKQAQFFLKKAADQDWVEAQYVLGKLYLLGEDFAQGWIAYDSIPVTTSEVYSEEDIERLIHLIRKAKWELKHQSKSRPWHRPSLNSGSSTLDKPAQDTKPVEQADGEGADASGSSHLDAGRSEGQAQAQTQAEPAPAANTEPQLAPDPKPAQDLKPASSAAEPHPAESTTAGYQSEFAFIAQADADNAALEAQARAEADAQAKAEADAEAAAKAAAAQAGTAGAQEANPQTNWAEVSFLEQVPKDMLSSKELMEVLLAAPPEYRTAPFQAFSYLNKAAQHEHIEAQVLLGALYRDGIGVKADYQQAVRWFNAASRLGSDLGTVHLAKMCLKGKGTKADPQLALEFLQPLVAQGCAAAQLALGEIYLAGKEVSADLPKGLELLTQAASQGYAPAQLALGLCYAHGTAGVSDLKQAQEWLDKAARQGLLMAQLHLNKLNLVHATTPQEHFLAMLNIDRLAHQGLGEALFYLGQLYLEGQHVKANFKYASYYFMRAAYRGYPLAQKLYRYL